MEANLINMTAIGTPMLAIPMALIFGLRKTLILGWMLVWSAAYGAIAAAARLGLLYWRGKLS